MRKMRLVLLTIISIVSLTSVAFAGFTNSEFTFTNNLASGYYLENFYGYGYDYFGPLGTNVTFNGGDGYSYNVSSNGDEVWSNYGRNISTEYSLEPLQITFTGAPVTAVGGQFFISDFDGNGMYGQEVQVTFSDNSNSLIKMSEFASPFIGYTSNVPISSLTIVGFDDGSGGWPTVANLYVGAAAPVPIPAAIWFLGSGLVGLVGVRRKFKL